MSLSYKRFDSNRPFAFGPVSSFACLFLKPQCLKGNTPLGELSTQQTVDCTSLTLSGFMIRKAVAMSLLPNLLPRGGTSWVEWRVYRVCKALRVLTVLRLDVYFLSREVRSSALLGSHGLCQGGWEHLQSEML